jgi:hypothetical protein
MIYDCFTFFNELELLELRLHEMAGVVDKFVLVEANLTHSGQPKPLHFHENRARFSAFAGKIIHIIVDDAPAASGAWAIERFQRNAIARGLRDCRPEDWVLVSDVDEIPRAATVAKISRDEPFASGFFARLKHGALNSAPVNYACRWKGLGYRSYLRKHHPYILKFEQSLHRHYLNCVSQNPRIWHGTRMVRFRDYSTADEVRYSGQRSVPDGGWHFTFMGGAERIRDKIQAYAHQEYNKPQFTDTQSIAERMNRAEPLFGTNEELAFVPLDESFPRYILENREKYAAWIKPL